MWSVAEKMCLLDADNDVAPSKRPGEPSCKAIQKEIKMVKQEKQDTIQARLTSYCRIVAHLVWELMQPNFVVENGRRLLSRL